MIHLESGRAVRIWYDLLAKKGGLQTQSLSAHGLYVRRESGRRTPSPDPQTGASAAQPHPTQPHPAQPHPTQPITIAIPHSTNLTQPIAPTTHHSTNPTQLRNPTIPYPAHSSNRPLPAIPYQTLPSPSSPAPARWWSCASPRRKRRWTRQSRVAPARPCQRGSAPPRGRAWRRCPHTFWREFRCEFCCFRAGCVSRCVWL